MKLLETTKMQKEFWQQRWKSNQIGFNQLQPNPLLELYFPRLNLKPNSRIFVPLCGKSIDMLWLANQHHEIIGVELSPIACEAFFNSSQVSPHIIQTDKFTVYQHSNITLISGDFFDLNKKILGQVDAVYDRAALIALPEDLRRRYASFLISLLKPKTPMLLISNSYHQNEMEGPPFSVSEQEIHALYGEHYGIAKLHDESASMIPEHLKAKGLTSASEQVYYFD